MEEVKINCGKCMEVKTPLFCGVTKVCVAATDYEDLASKLPKYNGIDS